ncbi:MAG: phospho-N-acetylmuramoyl-pentapeptide-transferase, partial [Candidatus Omnitrophica bacterium]|nr:phospho-N-acetylmuramoyl-pentapeptide-transferase [Candidatus Omnitrophota bacterium]
MFYYLSELKELFFALNIFRYITFRAGMAAVTTFLLCIIFGPFFIDKLRRMKIHEINKRKDCPDLDQFQNEKEGTPTMGGVFVIGSILISVLLWADLSNRYILLTLVTCFSLALLGFADDYIKLTNPVQRGVKKRTKLVWQIMLGFFIGTYVYFNPDTNSLLHFPFLKNAVINLGLFYIPFTALVVIGSSNAVNLTDGLDG